MKQSKAMVGNKGMKFSRLFCSSVNSRQAELLARGLPKRKQLPGVKNVVVVASGKGGVGKSTVAVNLAVTLALLGHRVGLLDADVFGPSVPLMMNIKEEPLVDERNLMIPAINYGVKCMSMGLLAQNGSFVWRGPLVMSAIQRLLFGTKWDPLDTLIVDTPPGTGDVHLSLAQNISISGVILVSTPQLAALEVTSRGADMYNKLNIPTIGLIENMRHAICTKCNSKIQLFPNVTEKFAKNMNIDIIASLPIESNLAESCDAGMPFVLKQPKSVYSVIFGTIATRILDFIQNKKTSMEQ